MTFAALLDAFRDLRALVVGDLMLDEYHFGSATRISPEAPVMVIRHERSTRLPGGAANVALNLKALGAETVVVGVAGADPDGDALERSLADSGLEGVSLIRDASRATTKKTRIVADHSHQVLRIDFEASGAILPKVEDQVLEAIQREAPQADVILLSDYLKGVCTAKVADWAIRAAKKHGIPVAVNPKPPSLAHYRGASLVSLNLKEATEAFVPPSLFEGRADEAARHYLDDLDLGSILVTLGSQGMAATGVEGFRIGAPKVEVYDTAGAGDTVIATAALGMAAAGFRREVFELAAQTSACVVRHVGVATPSPDDLAAIREMEV